LKEKVAAPVLKTEITAVGIRHADQVEPSFRKQLSLTSLISGGRLVGIVRSRTQVTEFSFIIIIIIIIIVIIITIIKNIKFP
jgi:hypothetical protein